MLKLATIISFSLILVACQSKLGKFQSSLEQVIKTNDSIGKSIQRLDTNYVLKLRGKSRQLLLQFNIELGNDTLDLEATKSIDEFVNAYRSTDFFIPDLRSLRVNQLKQQKRLELLKSDIQQGNGDRLQYFAHIQHELSEAKIMRKHNLILENHFNNFKAEYLQFKPIFELFISMNDSL